MATSDNTIHIKQNEQLTNSIENKLKTTNLGSSTEEKKQHYGIPSTSCLSHLAGKVHEEAKRLGKSLVKWDNPKSVMIITKPKEYSLIPKTRELALWLIETPRYGQDSGITVYVDEKLQYSLDFKYKKVLKHYPNVAEKLRFWNPELCTAKPEMFDYIITLGGDGTVLFTSWLFQSYVPPVIPFHLGSLGFLTPFDFEKYGAYLTRAMEDGVRINLRGRLTCTVYRRVPLSEFEAGGSDCMAIKLRNIKRNSKTGKICVGGWCKKINSGARVNKKKKKVNIFGELDGILDDDGIDDDDRDIREPSVFMAENGSDDDGDENGDGGFDEHRRIPCFTTVPREQYEVINELVVDRGPSPYVSLLELFGNNKHLTTVQADGLAISTPTGSTAYSLSAGGSLTHPEIHAILITPICPHTLSFRSTLVPDSMELRVCVPYNSRNTAWASFDGRGRLELKQGDHIKVTASKHPFPTVCQENQTVDWFGSVQNCLHWNRRQRQKSFAVVESNAKATKVRTGSGTTRETSSKQDDSGISSAASSSTPASPTQSHHRLSTDGTATTASPPSSSASENGKEEVFGVFNDSYRKHEMDQQQHEAEAGAYGFSGVDSNESSGAETDDEDDDTLNDDDESALSTNGERFTKGLQGWTDEEISLGRSNVTNGKHGAVDYS